MNEITNIVSKKDLAVGFIILENMETLYLLKKIVNINRNLPMIVVSNDPQYALECMRLKVKHYILLPLETREIKEAMKDLGVVI